MSVAYRGRPWTTARWRRRRRRPSQLGWTGPRAGLQRGRAATPAGVLRTASRCSRRGCRPSEGSAPLAAFRRLPPPAGALPAGGAQELFTCLLPAQSPGATLHVGAGEPGGQEQATGSKPDAQKSRSGASSLRSGADRGPRPPPAGPACRSGSRRPAGWRGLTPAKAVRIAAPRCSRCGLMDSESERGPGLVTYQLRLRCGVWATAPRAGSSHDAGRSRGHDRA